MPTNPLIFNPSPQQADQVIHDLGSPHLTLRDVAELYNTTIQSLTLWIALPETSSRLSNINNAVVTRSRHVACNYLARATETVITSLDAYIDEEKHIPVRPSSIEDREQRRRSRQTACHAVSLLLRIAKFNPAPPRPSGPPRKRRYTTAHSNRINEVLTKLGAPPSLSAEEQADRVAADSPSASPAPLRDTSPSNPRQHTNGDHYNRITDLVADLDPKSPSRREGLGWVPSSPDQQSSDDSAHTSATNAPNELADAPATNGDHHNRITDLVTDLDPKSPSRREGLGWVPSSPDQQSSDDSAHTSATNAPNELADAPATNGDHSNRITDLVTDLDPKSPSRREGLGWVRSSHDQQSSDDPAQIPPTNAPSNPLPAAGRDGEGLANSAVESQAPTSNNHTSRLKKLSLPPPKRGDPDWEPWMANGELPWSVEKKLRQQSDSITPNTAATLQARAGAPQPFTPLTISAQNSNGKTHSCSTPCARACPTPHPP